MKKLVPVLLCFLAFAHLALAEEADSKAHSDESKIRSEEPKRCADESKDHDGDSGKDCWAHRKKMMMGSFSFSPRYYQLNSDGYSSAFGGNGFNSPNSGTVGFDFTFYLSTRSDWQFGFGFGDLGYSNENGANVAEYTQDYFGLWLGKSMHLSDDFEIAFGSLFSWGSARMEVITPSLAGRTDEQSFIVAPKLLLAYKVSRWLKVGVSASYLEPLAQADSVKGMNLTPGNISIHGASAGVEFILGYFGSREHAEERDRD